MQDNNYKHKYHKYKMKYLQLNGGKESKIVFISGISGSGKSTLGKEIATQLHGKFIDQDWFFVKNKPTIKLSNGKILKNWDHEKALDMKTFNNKLREAKKTNKYIVVSGFALRNEWIDHDNKPDIHIHIKVPKELSLQTRLKLKPGNKIDQTLMFNEAVLPFYYSTLEKSNIDYFINGTINDSLERRPKQEMIDEIMGQINKL